MRPNGVWDPETISSTNRYHLSEDLLSLRVENVMYEDRGKWNHNPYPEPFVGASARYIRPRATYMR